ncbi:DUF262 domain-containing protein [Marinobacter nauticus]|uniref:DUF262 domain-containing protein n=1 Tax=Marinobacter nauticus TaxID=2743 RepID=UPI001C56BD42|nr:DUF262 domain-containing protein [Marinobacter nauticus]MBW3198133.1 DUF262 domain-containing protein [Marinobacter nauticus]MBY6183543.1 DUF262 domain-containing protein [Marinobacter nauticus]
MHRKQNFQAIAWFNDLMSRDRLDLDPPYQRRSVWNQDFKDYFIDTLLLDYPAPALFLYEEISADGLATYHVVDGKQRLTTIFEFVNDEFPVSEKAEKTKIRGKYFSELDTAIKKDFWSYQFSVEYLPTDEEGTINKIFDRINRNTAKLTSQELRHAQFDGDFITTCEELADWTFSQLDRNFPKISPKARKQMKDVEFISTLLLFSEIGTKGLSTTQLDAAFSERDIDWEAKPDVESEYRECINRISAMTKTRHGSDLMKSRMRNQADFYSLYASVASILRDEKEIDAAKAAESLLNFSKDVDDAHLREQNETLAEYYSAARSASNDSGPRNTRIKIIKDVLAGSII